MKLLSFQVAGSGEKLGALVGDKIFALPGSMVQFFALDASARQAAVASAQVAYDLNDVTFLPPITNPSKIVCVGLNYATHIKEMGRELPKFPVLFAKFANTLVGHEGSIPYPTVSDTLDYEGELAFIIGRTAKNVKRADAFAHIAGYTCFNDVSVREYQQRTIQFLQGKTFDGTGPCGPVVVTTDEIPNPAELQLTTRLNGQTMQQSGLDDLVFDVPTLLEVVSEIMTLNPGDMIVTGTPGGVGTARKPPIYMKPGDVVEVEISKIGILRNRVA